MSSAEFLAIAAAVALGVALAPAIRRLLAVLAGVALVICIVGGLLGGAVWMFLVPWFWPEIARSLGLFHYVVPLVALGVSAGAMKITEWVVRATTHAEPDLERDTTEERRREIELIGDLLHEGVATHEDIDRLHQLRQHERKDEPLPPPRPG